MQQLEVLIWWFLMMIIGVVGTPIAFAAFRFLPDRGYAFSKPLGLLLFGLIAWLVGFLQFSRPAIWLSLLLLSGISAFFWHRNKNELRQFLYRRWRYILSLEIFFLGTFVLYLSFRMFTPEIEGTEKFMDMAFFHSIQRAQVFPPPDPWMAGHDLSISYYYLGYLLTAIICKLSGAWPSVGFNLALGLIFSLSAVSALGLLFNMTRSFTASLLGWGAIFLLGNLDGARQVLKKGTMIDFNWWDPSRVVENTIDEFPFFSFLLGDLHPHVLSIPFFLVGLGFALNHLKSDASWRSLRFGADWWIPALWGLVCGALGFLNTWDVPTVFLLSAASVLLGYFALSGSLIRLPWSRLGTLVFVVAFCMTVPFLPFTLSFSNQVQGVGLTDQRTDLLQYLLMFGLFLAPALLFVLLHFIGWLRLISANTSVEGLEQQCAQCGARLRPGRCICGSCGGAPSFACNAEASAAHALPLSYMSALLREFFVSLAPADKSKDNAAVRPIGRYYFLHALPLCAIVFAVKGVTASVLLFCLLAAVPLLFTRVDLPERLFSLMLLVGALLISFACEFVFVRDGFGPPLERMNTVFKLYYHAWFLFGLCAASGFYWSVCHWLNNRVWRWTAITAVCLLCFAAAVYSYASVLIKTDYFQKTPTLDGAAYLEQRSPGDYKAIEWLRRNVRGQAVLAEATGGQYSQFARVSVFTGIPAVIGWALHELQWRGSFDEAGKREQAVDRLYSTESTEEAASILRQYDIDYVFAGELERTKYTEQNLAKFSIIMESVFSEDGTTIYRRKP